MLKLPNPLRFVSGALPILRWSRNYDLETGIGDLIAGITVALTLIPQSIAYASLAGLEAQYGLYASFMGGFIYAIMGTSPQINIGPTALLSLLTATYTSGTNPDFAVLLCFMAGIIEVAAGILQLGFLVDLVSLPVVSGFTSAAAVTIASSQVKGLLGLKFQAETFLSIWWEVIRNIGETRLADTLLSLACCIVLMGMKALKDIKVNQSKNGEEHHRHALQKVLWLAGVARNAVVVLTATVIAYFVNQDKNTPFILTGRVTPGIPVPRMPVFETVVGNTTYTAKDMFGHIGSGFAIVPIVAIIANVAIAKAFSNGKTLDATQEIIALGVCNFVGALFRSLPVNGSFSRSAVSETSGVKTPAAGLYTGVIVLLTLAFLTPYFYFIPRSALSAVIVCAVLHMVDVDIVKKLWTTNKLDIIPLIGTFLSALGLGVEMGLVCGIVIDVLLLVFYNAIPQLNLQIVNEAGMPPHYVVHPVWGIHFVGAERLRSQLTAIRSSNARIPRSITALESGIVVDRANGFTVGSGNYGQEDLGSQACNVLVVHCDSLYRLDWTSLQSLKMVESDWSRGGHVIWCDVKPSLQKELSVVLKNPIFCHYSQLKDILTSLSFSSVTSELQPAVSDTHL